jgi:hypothetical protein
MNTKTARNHRAQKLLRDRTRTQRATARITRRGTGTLTTHAIAAGLQPREARTVAGSLRNAAKKLGLTGTPERVHAGRRMRDARHYTPTQVAAMCTVYRPRKPAFRNAAARLALAA